MHTCLYLSTSINKYGILHPNISYLCVTIFEFRNGNVVNIAPAYIITTPFQFPAMLLSRRNSGTHKSMQHNS